MDSRIPLAAHASQPNVPAMELLAGRNQLQQQSVQSNEIKLQKQLYDAYDGMTPHEFAKSQDRVNAFYKTSQLISSIKDPAAKAAAWKQSADDLLTKGYINPMMHDQMLQSGPDDNLLHNQVVTAKQWTDLYMLQKQAEAKADPNKIAKMNAEIEKIGAGTAATNALTGQREAKTAQIKSGGGAKAGKSPEEIAARIAKLDAETVRISADAKLKAKKLNDPSWVTKAYTRDLSERGKLIFKDGEDAGSLAIYNAARAELMKQYGVDIHGNPVQDTAAPIPEPNAPAPDVVAPAPDAAAPAPLQPTASAIDYLRQHPELAPAFEKKYGISAQSVLSAP